VSPPPDIFLYIYINKVYGGYAHDYKYLLQAFPLISILEIYLYIIVCVCVCMHIYIYS